jgi:hypothetical protein
MTVKIPRWWGGPPEFFELRRHVGISRGGILLFTFLYWMSDKRSSRRLVFEEDELAEMADISQRRLGDARKQLSERGLVLSERQRGGKYVYELCDIATGQPYPGDPKAKVAYKKKSPPMTPPADETPAALAAEALPENVGDACELGLEDCDVSFEFGWNVVILAEQPVEYAFDFG